MAYSNISAIRQKQNKPNQTQFQTQFQIRQWFFLPITQEIVGANKITLKIYPFGIDYPIVLKERFFDLWERQ